MVHKSWLFALDISKVFFLTVEIRNRNVEKPCTKYIFDNLQI